MIANPLAATTPFPEPSMCDFCDRPATAAALTFFPCRDFRRHVFIRGESMLIETCTCHTPIIPLPGDEIHKQRVIGAWAACALCAGAIRSNDAAGLAELAAASFREREPVAAALPLPLPPLTIIEDGQPRTVPAASWAAFYQAIHIAFWHHREGGGS